VSTFLRKSQEASEKFEKAVKIKPDFAMAWYGWSQSLKSLGKVVEAQKKLLEAKKHGLDIEKVEN